MAHLLAQNWLLNRRHVLRGVGVAMALPLLECMTPLRASESKNRAKRSVFIYLPNGVNTLDYQITKSGADYSFSKSLLPLEKHRANITPISGLHHPHGLGASPQLQHDLVDRRQDRTVGAKHNLGRSTHVAGDRAADTVLVD